MNKQLPIRIFRGELVLAIGLGCATLPASALAQAAPGNDQIQQLQHEIEEMRHHYETQIRNLQRQLNHLKAGQAAAAASARRAQAAAAASARQAEAAAASAPPARFAPPPPSPVAAAAPPPLVRGGIMNTGVKVTLGGFIEGASIFRTRNETADISSNFNTGIPFPNSPNYHLSELRFSAHQSRFSLLAQGDVNPDTTLAAYFETDFQSAATTSNSVESNSYNPRLRLFYGTLDRKDLGLHFLFGQSWSLLTMFSHDMTPRQENIPLTIDGQYAVGFTWTRNPQFRVVKDIGKTASFGVSLESPQAVIFSGPNAPLVPTTFNNPGGMLLNSLATYSTDPAPDVVAKLAVEPGWGHYEAYGISRWFRSRADFANHTVWGGGAGLGAILPLVPKRLDAQADFLYGEGIGRYGTAQLPDATVKPDGILTPIPEIQALLGLVGHPTDRLDLYLYGGLEQEARTYVTFNGKPYGYGNPLYDNSGCDIEGSTVCASSNTHRVWQVTGGLWYNLYKGRFGMARIGEQASYTRRDLFPGIGGGPSTDEVIVLTSLRYYPF